MKESPGEEPIKTVVDKPLRPYLDEFREIVDEGFWSRAVRESREAEINFSSENDDIIMLLRLSAEKRATRLSFSCTDFTYLSNCSCNDDPCIHLLVAAIKGNIELSSANLISVDPAGLRPQKMPRSDGSPILAYYLDEKDGALIVSRYLVNPSDNHKTPFKDSLVEYVGGISSGRIKALMPLVSTEDYVIDRALGLQKRGDILPELRGDALRALSSLSNVHYGGSKVKVKDRPEQYRLRAELHADGVQISAAHPSDKNEPDFHFVKEGTLYWREFIIDSHKALVCRGRKIRFENIADFLSCELPELLRQGVIVEPPEATGEWPVVSEILPSIVYQISLLEDGFAVTPVIAYGNPPLAEVGRSGYQLFSTGIIPKRDLASEKNLSRKELSLSEALIGRTVVHTGSRAVIIAERLAGKVTKGDSLKELQNVCTLEPVLEEHEDALQLVFKIDDKTALSNSIDAINRSDTASPEEVFGAYRKGDSFVRLASGKWARLPATFLKQVDSLGIISRFSLGIPVAQFVSQSAVTGPIARARSASNNSLLALGVSDIIGESGAESVERFLEKINSAKARGQDYIDRYVLPMDLKLRRYQVEGISWLRGLSEISGAGALLADDMGLGKTLQAILSLRFPALVVVPTSVISQWEQELKRFYPEAKLNVYHGTGREWGSSADITLTTYGVVRVEQEFLQQKQFSIVVLDEAQNIKNPISGVSQAACCLQAEFRLCLTGTPVENSMKDLWSIFRFLMPGFLPSLEALEDLYLKEGGARIIRKMINPFVKRRLKSDVLTELPPRTEILVPCIMEGLQREAYDSILEKTRKDADLYLENNASILGFFEMLLRLRQICVHPHLAGRGADIESVKMNTLIELLKASTEAGHKVLVFSQWTSALDILGPRILNEVGSYLRLDGSTRNRPAIIDSFKNSPEVQILLLSLKAGGVGLNLTEADHVYFLDSWWNPAVEQQAADRVHRMGQDKPVFIYKLVAKDSIEEKIQELHKLKSSLSDSLLSDLPQAGKLDKDDLRFLLS